MLKILLIVFTQIFITIIYSSNLYAGLNSISILPLKPINNANISITIDGTATSDSSEALKGNLSINKNNISITIVDSYFGGVPLPPDYLFTYELGALAPGSYTVNIYEELTNSGYPGDTILLDSTTFEVIHSPTNNYSASSIPTLSSMSLSVLAIIMSLLAMIYVKSKEQ